MATASELIAQAEEATTTEELDAIEDQSEGRVTVLQAVDDARARLEQQQALEPETQADEPDPTPESDAPDFVWVGHASPCWTPKDRMRPILTYQQWLADGYRRLVYRCMGCGQEIHSSLWGFWLQDARPYEEGGLAATPTEVQTWGN